MCLPDLYAPPYYQASKSKSSQWDQMVDNKNSSMNVKTEHIQKLGRKKGWGGQYCSFLNFYADKTTSS